jgi:MtN3 and saliva related transmembrane protein
MIERRVDEWALAALLASVVALSGCQDLGIHDAASLLAPTFKRSELVGILAGFGTTFAGLPDLVGMLRRRSTAGMNPRMAAILCGFQLLWVYYGLLILSRPVVVWNLIAIVTNGLTVAAYVHFARRESSSPPAR